jgi:hypothetical protein
VDVFRLLRSVAYVLLPSADDIVAETDAMVKKESDDIATEMKWPTKV